MGDYYTYVMKPTRPERVSFDCNIDNIILKSPAGYKVPELFDVLSSQVENILNEVHSQRLTELNSEKSVFDVTASSVTYSDDSGVITEKTLQNINDILDGAWLDYFEDCSRGSIKPPSDIDIPNEKNRIYVEADEDIFNPSTNMLTLELRDDTVLIVETPYDISKLLKKTDTLALTCYTDREKAVLNTMSEISRENVTLFGLQEYDKNNRIYYDADTDNVLKSDVLSVRTADNPIDEVYNILHDKHYYTKWSQFFMELFLSGKLDRLNFAYGNNAPVLTKTICDELDIHMCHVPQIGQVVLSHTEINTNLFNHIQSEFPETQSLTETENRELTNILNHPSTANYSSSGEAGKIYELLLSLQNNEMISTEECFYYELAPFRSSPTKTAILNSIKYGNKVKQWIPANSPAQQTFSKLREKWENRGFHVDI